MGLWPVQRYDPEKRIVAALYRALSDIARTSDAEVVPHGVTPPNSAQFSDAQDALVSLSRDHNIEAEHLIFLLNQAERIRLSLLTLARLCRRIRRDDHGMEVSDLLVAALHAAAPALDAIATATRTGTGI